MGRTRINSSNIAAAEYISEGKLLEIEFKSGRTYRYRGVPLDLFCGMLQAESQGAFFKSEIEGKFETEEVE